MISADPSHRDLAWRGYSGWAMLPSFSVCSLLSLVLLTGGWFFEDIRGVWQEIGMLIFFAATMGIWIAQLFRWLYRGATYIYRLTPDYLFIDRGFLYQPEAPIELGDITSVEWGSNALSRFFGVGWVVVRCKDREPVTLTGILRPAGFAEEIQAAKTAVTA